MTATRSGAPSSTPSRRRRAHNGGMKARRYTVVLEPGEDGGIVVTFPAFPGCVTQGSTREEAMANAREVLELTIEDMLGHGEQLPDETQTVEILESRSSAGSAGRLRRRLYA